MHDEGGEAGGSSQSPVSPTADSSHTDASQGCAGHMKSGSPGAENRPRWNLCSMHQNSFLRFRKNHSVSVACQTDATEDFPTRSSSVCSKTASAEATSSNTADGVLRLMIQNFPNMNDTVRGPSKRINGVSWRIMVMPRQHVVQKKGTQKCLGFFLQCCPDAYSDSWSCQASAELRLISQKPGVMHFTRKTTHNYTAKENDWGYSCFMTWADILDENQGYIKEDKVVLEVAVKAEPPKQIVTLEEFKKTIKGWYDLAELHYSRGHIDRALEANAQGLKFCKDRDNACKERLEKQKSFFVEQKVVERIQHIEQKGNTVVAEDDANSQNALRMALTQTTTQKTNVAKGKTNKKATMTKKKTRAGTPTGQLDKKSECKEEKTWMDGNFSKSLLLQRRDREDSYTTFTKHICELTADPLALEDPETKDGLGYMFDQIGLFHVARLDYPNGKFHNTPLELELQRQLMVKKAVQFAEEYTARVARNEDLMSLECEDMEEVDIGLLFKPNAESRMAERLDIVDRQAEFLDAKVRLFWNFIQLEDDCSFSDPASPCSSDSESANGDGPQMKRSRCEDEDGRACEHCALSNKFERLIIGPPLTADSHCQTDPVSCETYVVASDALHKKTEGNETTPIPTARQQKRPTAKAVSKKNNKGVQKATLGTQSEQKKESSKSSTVSPIGDMVDGTQFVQGMRRAASLAVPSIPPMEFAMKFYQQHFDSQTPPYQRFPADLEKQVVECTKCFMLDDDMEGFLRASMARVWTLVRGGDDKPTAGTNTSWDSFYTTYVGQMLPAQQIDLALSVIAICCLNAKKAEERLSAITQHIDKKIRNPDVQNALRTLCKLGDMVVVEDDEDSGSPLHEERRAGGEDYLLSCHLTRLDNLRQKAEKYTYYVHNKDAERLMQAVIAVEQKCTQMEKERAKLLRAIEEQKKETERAERNHARALGDLRAEKEAKDKVNNQLKEKNKEIKKHEKRIKELSAQVEEKDELKEHKDHLQKDLNAERRRAQDLDSRLKHEQHAREEQRRHLQSELSSRDQDYARVLQSNEELKAQLKKMEAQLAQEKRTSHTALSAQGERAKKAEMAYIKYLYETDARKLERAKEDAIKNMKDMEDAAANRSRTANEQQAFAASRDEWKAKSEEIMVLIHKAKNEYNSHMEALKSGKELSQLPTLTIAKPPPPCKILPIPPPQPVAPIEPPKPSPGVIGSRSTSSIGQLPTPIGSNISPKSKAPGSPIQKPVAAVASQPQMGSPARHPGAIGTRISNGGESVSVSGLGSAAPGSSSSGTGWHWNDYNFSDNILSTNRSLGSLTGEYGTSALTCTSSTVARDVPSSNGWNDDGWGQKTTSSTSGATLLTGLGTVSPTYGSLWEDRRPSQAPQAPQQANRYTLILEKLSECFPGVPNSRLVEWANDYCTHYKTNLSQEPIPAAVQLLQNHIVSKLKADAEASRRLLGTSIQPSHGVNPSYLNMGGLLGSEPSARQTPNQLMNTYNSFMEPSLLNGDTSRNVLGDKWSF